MKYYLKLYIMRKIVQSGGHIILEGRFEAGTCSIHLIPRTDAWVQNSVVSVDI